MKLLYLIISSFVFGVLYAQVVLPPVTQAPQFLPCVSCANENDPVCAQSIHGGEPQTFQSLCIMQAYDCGHYEHQNKLLYKGACK